MAPQALSLLLSLFLLGCASVTCPRGTIADRPRAQQILALARSVSPVENHVTLCFAPGRGRGVLSQDTLLLDDTAATAELAAQVAHLLVHRRDRLGDGCARGRAVAADSEARAVARETAVRAALQLPPTPPPDGALDDYRRRCAE